MNGASHLMTQVFGPRDSHARIALGIADMPLNAAVQLAVWAELRT